MSEYLNSLLVPRSTGKFVVVFKKNTATSIQQSIMDKAFVAPVVSVNSERDDMGVNIESAQFSTIFEELEIAYTPKIDDSFFDPKSLKAVEIQKSFMASEEFVEHVEFIRPEYFLEVLERDTKERTWGVEVVGAFNHVLDGTGIKVAVLDTGIDADHPDFVTKSIVSKSFNGNVSVEDIHGHGTHCAGIIAGPRNSHFQDLGQYGVAPNVDLYVGKTVRDSGSGEEEWTVQGILWAIQNDCDIISMSLGWPVKSGTPYDRAFERVCSKALSREALIIAAAGNDSSRFENFIAPVRSPANSPSTIAVAAIDWNGIISDFSNSAVHSDAYGVDIAAPGARAISSFPMPRRFGRKSGTSQATPFVAGIAALYAQQDSTLRGKSLKKALLDNAELKSTANSEYVGAGIVKAPTITFFSA